MQWSLQCRELFFASHMMSRAVMMLVGGRGATLKCKYNRWLELYFIQNNVSFYYQCQWSIHQCSGNSQFLLSHSLFILHYRKLMCKARRRSSSLFQCHNSVPIRRSRLGSCVNLRRSLAASMWSSLHSAASCPNQPGKHAGRTSRNDPEGQWVHQYYLAHLVNVFGRSRW